MQVGKILFQSFLHQSIYFLSILFDAGMAIEEKNGLALSENAAEPISILKIARCKRRGYPIDPEE